MKNTLPFVDRSKEIRMLNSLTKKKVSSLVVIKGRRRIGKSRLVKEFAAGKRILTFSGLPPNEKTTAQSQRDDFANQLSTQTNLPAIQADDWSKLFLLLAKETEQGQVIILFDEISWMGSKDPDFLGKLKNAWDLYFKNNPKLILILCGSVSSWIEKNILKNTGFFGRIGLKLTLEELSLKSCNTLLEHIGFKRSAQEKFEILSITGGVPWYLELIHPDLSSHANIRHLCFRRDGVLVDEFKFIFHDLFGRRGSICQEIVTFLANGPAEFLQIASALNYSTGGNLSEYLDDLIISGFISRDYTWNLKSGIDSRLSRFRLKDNYLRFYLKYMASKVDRITKGQFEDVSLSNLPNWDGLMGLQFENLVLNNRKLIQQKLGITPDDIVTDNPFFQHQTTKQKGCQIDYLIQTQRNTLFVCEIKFSKKELNTSVIQSVKEKLSRLTIPRGFACIPVLIHVNGISQNVSEADYFYKEIDFNQLLSSNE